MTRCGRVVTRAIKFSLRNPFRIQQNSSSSYIILKSAYHTAFSKCFTNNQYHQVLNKPKIFFSQSRAMSALSPMDPSSFSRPDLSIVKHIALSLNVDFEKKVLSGVASLDIDIVRETSEVILDVSNLTIESIESDGTPLNYTVGDEIPNFGSKLTIYLPKSTASGEKLSETRQKSPVLSKECISIVPSSSNSDQMTTSMVLTFTGFMYELNKVSEDRFEDANQCGSHMCAKNISCYAGDTIAKIKLKIKYSTAPTASALQWLDPAQTSGKKHPYLFSQCQPIHARSILPCQDTPAVKFTYSAEVTAPPQFTVLMSALRGEVNGNVTSFRQPVPLPSYLVAIAVGALEFRPLGPRSKVWSEKEEVERSAWEFSETERYLQAAERLCGPYVWGQYDLLVLPPSFPYGGMENPCLTFVTPTLLAGDRSQADVIVHEIMHSWTGNLVTNRNFEHFWLNEGFTVFLERKVGASLIADKEEARMSRDFHSILGLQELKETVNDELGVGNPLTKLVVNLKGVHPDDAFSTVPYEKGSLFLRYLENLLGGVEVFDEFLRSYLNKFARKSLDTDQFKAYLLEFFKDNEQLKTVDWDSWLNHPGMPTIIPNYDTTMTKAVTALVNKISQAISPEDVATFTPHQMINFLQTLVDSPPLTLERLRTLGEAYGLGDSKNTEIKFRWLRLCVRSKDTSKLDAVFDFVNSQGRMKYVRPVYRDLYAWEDVRQRAIDNFLQNEKYMMHVSAYTLRKDLHLNEIIL